MNLVIRFLLYLENYELKKTIQITEIQLNISGKEVQSVDRQRYNTV